MDRGRRLDASDPGHQPARHTRDPANVRGGEHAEADEERESIEGHVALEVGDERPAEPGAEPRAIVFMAMAYDEATRACWRLRQRFGRRLGDIEWNGTTWAPPSGQVSAPSIEATGRIGVLVQHLPAGHVRHRLRDRRACT